MISRHIYLQLIGRILFIVVSAVLAAYLYFDGQYIQAFLFLFALVVQSYYLIRYVNQTNRKIAYFFDALKNEDFSLRFPEKLSVKSLEELNHSLNRVNAMIQDIHLKKQAQEQYYEEIIKQADIGIMTINKKGHILFANSTIEGLLDYHPLNHIKQLKQVDEKLYALFEGNQVFKRKLVQLSNERGKKQISLKATQLALNHDELLLVVAQDIHQELDEKETDSWVRLIRVLTHEIMNTITPITSISESIMKYFPETGETSVELSSDQWRNTVKGLGVIKMQGQNLMEFVQSYRNFLNLPKPDKVLVKASILLTDIKTLLVPDMNEQLRFTVDCEPEDLTLFIDGKQMALVLINLCKNALQALNGQPDGELKLSAGKTEDGGTFVSVLDNGPGIAPELLDEIFVPFFTTKEGGSGIGLSLSRQIMHLHGGTIKVYSVLGKGTRFTLFFP
ncbi:sensor histidine kinase [Sediminicola luteus]|uniref:histidine kinase n=1 Tax=Sediminicola luteus TaxID=319238 RepID=A0A2A4GDW8_9FLAO|nr:ATP-binding protein [Sediminicola luteus]PCE66170.1 histidine kinase [Sediminicola luteus]